MNKSRLASGCFWSLSLAWLSSSSQLEDNPSFPGQSLLNSVHIAQYSESSSNFCGGCRWREEGVDGVFSSWLPCMGPGWLTYYVPHLWLPGSGFCWLLTSNFADCWMWGIYTIDLSWFGLFAPILLGKWYQGSLLWGLPKFGMVEPVGTGVGTASLWHMNSTIFFFRKG